MAKQKKVQRQAVPLKVSQLLFDEYNYRFPKTMQGVSQEELFKKLDQDYDLIPIGRSLAHNGYFAEEPLVVIPKGTNFIVGEGNRRLAALKLLLDGDLRRLSKDREEWEDLAKEIKKEDFLEVPAVIRASREELTPVLGFRHIAGIEKWKPLAKARYINDLVEEKGRKASFAEIAREAGSYTEPTIAKHYVAYRAYLQARDEFQIETTRIEKKYSLFFRACAVYNSMKRFVGIPQEGSPSELQRPVPLNKAERLEELIGYIYGTQEARPVIGESRDMELLAEVVDSRLALNYLRKNRDLKRAYELVAGERPVVIKNLTDSSYYLGEALKGIPRYKDDRRIEEMVSPCVEKISKILKYFPKLRSKLGTSDD